MRELPQRLQSIDVFRAITMFLMIFVNDVDGVEHIPEWIKHAHGNEDALGFADTIFPAFLFIVGLSLPFAISNRIKKGYSTGSIAVYILTRSLALLVMGFMHVNMENYNRDALLPEPVFEILLTLSFFLIWLDYPKEMNRQKRYVLQALGIAILVAMAVLFKGGTAEEPVGLQPYWWGILGLIGWSYLICAFVYLLARGRLAVLVVALLFFLGFNVAAHAHVLGALEPLHHYVWIVGDASMPALTMAGVVISVAYGNLARQGRQNLIWVTLLSSGIAFLLFGFATRRFDGISKIHATPSWVGICTGIGILVFALAIYLVDVKGKTGWFSAIRPAGTSTLTCYLIPYFLYSIYSLLHFHFPSILSEGIGGVLKSFATAFVVIQIAGWLERKRIRLSV